MNENKLPPHAIAGMDGNQGDIDCEVTRPGKRPGKGFCVGLQRFVLEL